MSSRFSEPQDPAFQALNASIGFDWRLGPYDIAQSRAHATMLAATGVISEADRDALLAGLVKTAVDSGRRLSELTREEIAAASPQLDEEYYAVLAGDRWLESKVSEGGTALARVREQLDAGRRVLAERAA